MRKVVNKKAVSWDVKTTAPPILTREEWLFTSLLGVLFIVMALSQLASFSDFSEILSRQGLTESEWWGATVILAELWGAASMFRLRLSYPFRAVSAGLALLVTGFWFVLNLQTVAGQGAGLTSSGFFGQFFNQSPGWWTILEVTILLFVTMHAVALTRYTLPRPKRASR